ncbi:WD repeat-containing protein pop2, partial [Hondaea fermentalgiana]
MVSVQDLIARFNRGRVGGAHAEVEVNEAAQTEAELQVVVEDQAEEGADLGVPEVLNDFSVLVVHDPADETVAEQLVEAIQPHLSVPVHTARQAAEARKEAKNAEVALLLVGPALQSNWKLVEAAARVLPNALVPILIDDTMYEQKNWKGAIAWYMPDLFYVDFCDPNKADVRAIMAQVFAARTRVSPALDSKDFHFFVSHERGDREKAIEIAQELRDRGLEAWLEDNEMSGSTYESMAEGIEKSKVFLVLATQRYMDIINSGDYTDYCLEEFQYACSKCFDRIVVAALEPDMMKATTKWTGLFKLVLSRQVPVDLTNFSVEAIDLLAEGINLRMQIPKAPSDFTPLMCDIYPRLNPCSSEAWAKGKAETFTLGTRSWVIDELCNWYNKIWSTVFILVGVDGVGKSVIMAELCHRGGALKTDEDTEKSKANESGQSRRKSSRVRSLWRRSKKERPPILVAAYHFFRHDDGTAASPAEAILSIAWQLCQTVPHFSEAIELVSFKGIREKTLAEVFKTVLVNPLRKVGFEQVRQVVVLDALDECSKSDDAMWKIICTWKYTMPTWLKLIVSTRPEGEIQRDISNNRLDFKVLEPKDEENFRDIEMHIEHLLCDMKDTVEQKDVASCAKILSERSEGLFLWASFLPETLNRMHEEKQGGLLTAQDISHKDAIPNGLDGMFKEYFERLREKVGGGKTYKMLLAPIVAAREPLSVEQLTVVLGKTTKETKTIIGNARNLLYQGGDGRVALIHKRMADWLVDFDQSGDLGVDIEDGHIALADYCISSRYDVFSLRHAVFHLVKSGGHAEAFELLNDFAWVKSAISVGDNEEQRRATIRNLIRDCVELDIYFAPESDTPRFLNKAVHALSYDPNELASQVLARLGHDSKDPLARSLQTPDQPWLEPTRVTLAHPRGPLLHMLKGHSDTVRSVAIQGDTIVSGSDDNTVRIWNATSGEEQHVLNGHSDCVRSVAIQGDTIVSGSNDGTVRIWNATSGEEQRVLEGHSGTVLSVAIQDDTIVSGSNDNTVRIWNA